MVVNEKGLCEAMKSAFKKRSTGYKVALCREPGYEPELVIAGPGWVTVFHWGSVPRKVLALIVEHLGALPLPGEAFQIQDKTTQAEIFDMAVPRLPEKNTGAVLQRTSITYQAYRVWQRSDDQQVFMIHPNIEALIGNYSLPLDVEEDGTFSAGGVASRLYITPMAVMPNDMIALNHLAELKWV